MSFSFAAAGPREHVLAQLGQVAASGNQVGEAARQLAADALAEPEDSPSAGGYQLLYVVKASGHSGGGSPTSLNLTIEAMYVPADPPLHGAPDAAAG